MTAENREWTVVRLAFDRSVAFNGAGVEPINIRVQLAEMPEFEFTLSLVANGEVRAYRVESESHDISAPMLRDVPFGFLRATALHEIRRVHERIDDSGSHPDVRARNRRVVKAWAAESGRPGRRGRGDIWYAQLAAWYVQHLDENAPLVALRAFLENKSEWYGSEVQLRGLLGEARRRGLLTKAPPGRAGGALTERATLLLKG